MKKFKIKSDSIFKDFQREVSKTNIFKKSKKTPKPIIKKVQSKTFTDKQGKIWDDKEKYLRFKSADMSISAEERAKFRKLANKER